jgi:hypothetical protein
MRWSILLAVLLAIGCERHAEPRHKDVVPLEQLPEAVMKAAKTKLPDIKFDSAWKTTDGAYEVRGKAKSGKIHDVRVSEVGDILEVD